MNEDKHASDASPSDWFLATFMARGGLAHALDETTEHLQLRLEFVQGLRRALYGNGERNIDVITGLSQRITKLETSLRVRLPLLQAERTAAWFRPSAASHGGPFAGAILTEPMFGVFVGRGVQVALERAWQRQRDDELPMHGPSLWLILLGLNRELADLGRAGGPLGLEPLPPGLTSASLEVFRRGLNQELARLQQQLDAIYEQLQQACEPFWQAYRQRKQAEQAEQAERRTHDASDGRRAGARGFRSSRSARDGEAMRVLGFASLPSQSELKQRYRGLARQLHPDLPGGDEQAFKRLAAAYTHLLAKVKV